jgi:hypothetical protein
VNATAIEQLHSLLDRRPFTVLGYSAEGSVWCAGCLRSAAGLSPNRGSDYDGNPILSLHARDEALRDECCDNCGKLLIDFLLERDASRLGDTRPVTATLHVYGQRWALSFDAVPPPLIREQLKRGAWRWDARYRLWWCATPKPEIPTGIAFPPDYAPRPEVFVRPPIRRPPRGGQLSAPGEAGSHE